MAGSKALNITIDPFPSAATERGKLQTLSPGGGAPKKFTSYLTFLVWPKLTAATRKISEIPQAYVFIQISPSTVFRFSARSITPISAALYKTASHASHDVIPLRILALNSLGLLILILNSPLAGDSRL